LIPTTEGLYVTPNVQVAPARSAPATHVPPAAGAAKSVAAPDVAVTVIVSGKLMDEAELFVMVKKNGAVAVPTNCIPKSWLAGEIEIVGTSVRSATNAFVAVLFNFDWITPGVTGKSEEEV